MPDSWIQPDKPIETRSFERKKWSHVIGIRSARIPVDPGEHVRLIDRLQRAAKYLHVRWQRTHDEMVSGGLETSMSQGYSDYFIRNQVAVICTWWVFDDVPSEFRADLEGIAEHIPAGRGPYFYHLMVPPKVG